MSSAFHLQIDTIAMMPGATDVVALGLSSLEGNTWNGEIIVGRIGEGTDEEGGKWNSRQIQSSSSVLTACGIPALVFVTPNTLCSAMDNGNLQLWTIVAGFETLVPTTLLAEHDDLVTKCKLHKSDVNVLASSSYDCTVKIWDLSEGISTLTIEGHFDQVKCLQWGHDGSTISSGGVDALLRVWDIRNPKSPAVISQLPHAISALSIAPHNDYGVALGCEDGSVHLIDVRKGAVPSCSRKDHRGMVTAIEYDLFSPSILASCSHDTTIKIRKSDSLITQHSVHAHTDYVTDVAWIEPGVIISSSWDKSIKFSPVDTIPTTAMVIE